MARNSTANIQSVDRALQLIERLAEESGGKRLLRLAEETGLAPSTTHRALQTLRRAGYVCQDRDSGRYRLTGKLLEVASAALSGRTLRSEAVQHLRRLRDLTGESSHLVVLDGTQALTVESALSSERNLVDCRVGERAPLHCTAVGKCLLAFLAPGKTDEIISRLDLQRFTERTLCTPSELLRDLAQVRKIGYATDWEENEIGVRCISAPVRNAAGEVIAAIGVSGPASRVSDDRCEALAASVVTVAGELSIAIGHCG